MIRPAHVLAVGTIALLLASFVPPNKARAKTTRNVIACSLTKTGPDYRGECNIPCAVNALAINVSGARSGYSCTTPDRIVPVTLRRQSQFDDWLGTMTGKEPEDPTRFAVVDARDGRVGVAKTPFGWFEVTQIRADGDTLTVVAAADRQLPPTEDDRRIIRRTIELLPSTARWNKADNRQCLAAADTLSLFCALMQATTEVSGGVHYRQPAMQAVREVLNEVGGDRVKLHRLMDYNHHPETTLDDIHTLLRKAEAKLR